LLLLARVAVFLVLLAAASEVWLRTVTPAASRPVLHQEAGSTMRVFDPGVLGEGVQTDGRLAHRVGRWRVNNDGWLSAVDYVSASERSRPLVAVFGDSFVEALMTDVSEHVDTYLSGLLTDTDVYGFGRSGWYLEQYVATARYARERYAPDLLVVFINAGDIEKSVRETYAIPPAASLWQISNADGRFTEVAPTPQPFSADWKTRLALRSAIVRYLVFNAEVRLPGMANQAPTEPVAQAASSAEAPDPESWRELLPAADYMVSLLCEENPGTPVLFVFSDHDADLRYLTAEELKSTPPFPDALAVQAASQEHPQCLCLDLRPVFSSDWAQNHRTFEAGDGRHWNGYANKLVAEAVAEFIARQNLLGGSWPLAVIRSTAASCTAARRIPRDRSDRRLP